MGMQGGSPWLELDGHVLREHPRHLLDDPFGGPLVQYLAADRIVLARYGKAGVLAASQPLDGEASRTWHALPASKDCDIISVAAHGKASYVGCTNGREVFAVWSSVAGGAWKHDFDVQFHDPDHDFRAALARQGHPLDVSLIAGPGGWLLAAGSVRVHRGAKPVPTKLAIGGWQSVTIGNTVYLLSCSDGECDYARATPAEPIPKPKSFNYSSGDQDTASLSVVNGQPRAVLRTHTGMFDVDPWATDRPKLRKDERLPKNPLRVLFHDSHGLALSTDGGMSGSTDGGAHWTKVQEQMPNDLWGTPVPDQAWCTDQGCQLGDHIRLGWQVDGPRLPKPIPPRSAPAPLPRLPDTRVECTVSGPVRRAPDVKHTDDLMHSLSVGGGIHWLTPDVGRGVRVIGELSDGTPVDVRLLPPVVGRHSNVDIRSRITRQGVVVVRVSWPKDRNSGSVVKAEIAGYRYSTRRVTRARLTKGEVGGRSLMGWIHGSAWYLSRGSRSAFVVGPHGRVTRHPLAVNFRNPGTVVELPTGPAGAVVDIDQFFGELWGGGQHVVWNLGGSARVGAWNGAPALGVDTELAGSFSRTEGFAIELGMTRDPHVVAHVTTASVANIAEHACEPGASGGVVTTITNLTQVSVKSQLDPVVAAGLVRLRPGHPPCVEGLVTSDANTRIAYVRLDHPDHSYFFEHGNQFAWKGLSERPMSCRLASGTHGP